MGNSVGVELKPPSLVELLGENDEPEKSPSSRGSIPAEPAYRSVLRGWKFSTSSNGLLGSTTPVHWLEFDGFAKDSCYLVVHAFVRDSEKSGKRKKSGSKDSGECDQEDSSDFSAGEPGTPTQVSERSAGEIQPPSARSGSGSNLEIRLSAAEHLTKLLRSTEALTPRGQQTVFGGYHAPGYNRKKMTAITYDIYVLRGQAANAISKSTATAKAVEVERLLSDASAQQAVRRLCFLSDEGVMAPLVDSSNLYCMESMGMDLWSQSVSRNHLFATITRYSSTRQSTIVRKSARSGSLPAKGHITTTKVQSPKVAPTPIPEPEPKAVVTTIDVPPTEEPAIKTPPSSRSKRKSRSKKKSKESREVKKKKPATSASGKTMLDHHFRSVSLPASEMKKLKSNAMGTRNVPAIKIPLGMTSLEQPVQEDEDDEDGDKPMGGASMAKKFDHICSQITESLFLGSDTVARDSRELRRNKITHILNCAGGYCGNYFPQQFEYMTLHLLDGKSENIACLFYEVLEFIDDAISNGGRVFVHCQQGVSRSSAMLILYLMWKMHKPFNETHEFVKKLRQASSPNAGFISQLMEWWKRHTTPLKQPTLYQVVPHCPVAPETMVFRSIPTVAVELLDKRGCFVLRDADRIYVWAGKACPKPLQEWGMRYAQRLKKYENDDAPVVEEIAGEESDDFKSFFSGSLAKVKKRSEYDSSYQLLKLPSRSSLEQDAQPNSPSPGSSRRKSPLSSSNSMGSRKKRRSSKRKMGDRVSSASKIGRLKSPDS